MSKYYKVEVYDVNGNFVETLTTGTFNTFSKTLNNGDSTLDLPLALDIEDQETALTLGNEFQIYDMDDTVDNKIYSGYLYSITRAVTGAQNQVTAHLVSYTGRLAKTFLITSGDVINILRDTTFSADTGGLDSGKSSDQMKLIVGNYRARNASKDQSQELTSTGIGFGSTTRLSQSFTTTSDAEKCKIVGFVVRLSYNTGTGARIDWAIRADDGTGKPTGANLALARIPNGTIISTTLRNYNVYLDTPLTLSASTKYHMQVASSSASATNTYVWRSYDTANNYTGGDRVVSTDSGATWTVQTNKDHYFKTLYVDESRVRLNYTSTSIDTSGDSRIWRYTAKKDLDAMDYVLKYGPSDWNYYIDASNTVHYHPAGFSVAKILDNCDSATGWTNGAAVTSINLITQSSNVTLDTSTANSVPTRREGSGSIAFTLDGTATAHYIYKSITAVDVSSYANAGCWLLVPLSTQLSDIRIRLYSGVNYSEWAINPGSLNYGDWNWLTPATFIGTTPTATSGTLDKTVMDKIALVINTLSSAEATTWYMDDWKAGKVELFRATYEKNILNFSYDNSIIDLVNRYVISNNATSSPLQNSYQDLNSIASYQTSEDIRVDGRITNEATMDSIGNDFIARNAYPQRTVAITVSAADPDLPIATLRPGFLIKLFGFPESMGFKNSYFVISQIIYDGTKMELKLVDIGKAYIERVSDVEQRLQSLESFSSSTGDTPAQTVFDE